MGDSTLCGTAVGLEGYSAIYCVFSCMISI
jgi:hypothetical protein